MAKSKKSDEPTFVVSVLIKSRDEVHQLLEKQIQAAEPILQMQLASRPHYQAVGMFGETRQHGVEYDSKEKEVFFNEYKKWNLMNREIFTRSFRDSNNTTLNEYDQAGHYYAWEDVVNEQKKAMRDQVAYIQSFIDRLPLIDSEVQAKEMPQSDVAPADSKQVFIVHGHDVNTRTEVENFVRSIGYEPIILCKRADMGNTIIEKIERESKDICYAIVIYTACDLGKDKDAANLTPRARQNVVFEHGFMCAKLGRSRVVALLEKGVEQPGDLSGVIYKPLDDGGMWKYAIAKEMIAVGLSVNMNKIG